MKKYYIYSGFRNNYYLTDNEGKFFGYGSFAGYFSHSGYKDAHVIARSNLQLVEEDDQENTSTYELTIEQCDYISDDYKNFVPDTYSEPYKFRAISKKSAFNKFVKYVKNKEK